jgi:hypothetical protein
MVNYGDFMNVEIDYKQIVGMVKERNRLFKALLEIQEIAENSSDSKLIVAKCKDALKSRPNILSKKTKEFIEDYEYRQEMILSGEIYEKFQI